MIDQLRSIDNKRFVKKMGDLPKEYQIKVRNNIKTILELNG